MDSGVGECNQRGVDLTGLDKRRIRRVWDAAIASSDAGGNVMNAESRKKGKCGRKRTIDCEARLKAFAEEVPL